MMAIKTAILSSLYDQGLGKSNAVRTELAPMLRLSGENSETVSRKSGVTEEERTIRKFRIVALEAALGLISFLSRRVFT